MLSLCVAQENNNNINNNNNNNTPTTLARVYVAMARTHAIQSNGCEEISESGQGAPLAENLIANRGTMHPWCSREGVDPRPSLGLNAMIP